METEQSFLEAQKKFVHVCTEGGSFADMEAGFQIFLSALTETSPTRALLSKVNDKALEDALTIAFHQTEKATVQNWIDKKRALERLAQQRYS